MLMMGIEILAHREREMEGYAIYLYCLIRIGLKTTFLREEL